MAEIKTKICKRCGKEKDTNCFGLRTKKRIKANCIECEENEYIIVESKNCIRCGQTKDTSGFSKNKETRDGFLTICKICSAIEIKEYKAKNKEKTKEYKERTKEQRRGYNKKYKSDPIVKLRNNIRARLKAALKCGTGIGSVEKLLCCSIPELRIYLEQQFYNNNIRQLSATFLLFSRHPHASRQASLLPGRLLLFLAIASKKN